MSGGITFWLSLWGAVLSTLLGLRTLTSGWPRVLLVSSPSNLDCLFLSIKNEDIHSIVVERIRTFPKGMHLNFDAPSTRAAVGSAINEARHNDRQIIVSPHKEIRFRFGENTHPKNTLLLLQWRSARIGLLPKIPLVLYISSERIRSASRQVVAEENGPGQP